MMLSYGTKQGVRTIPSNVDGSSAFGRQNLPLIFALEVGVTGDVSITDGKQRGADDDCLAPDSAGAFPFDEALPTSATDGTFA